MPVTLRIEETDELRTYVRELIGGQIRGLLREDILGIVHGEIAKHRLLDPSSPTLNKLIDIQVNAHIDKYLQRMNARITEEIRTRVDAEIAAHCHIIENEVKREFQRHMRTLYGQP